CIDELCRILRNESGDHAGENVTGTAGRHARISCRVDPHFSVRSGNERPMSLQDDYALMFPGKGSGQGDAVAKNFRYRAPAEPCHFARVRCDDEWVLAAVKL